MKKTIMILMSLTMSLFLIAQENSKQKEVGLVFRNLDNFGLSYKIGTGKSLWRFNTLFLSGGNINETADSLDTKSNNVGFRFAIGKEYRKIIIDDLELRLGADLFINYSQSKYDSDDKTIDDYDGKIYRTIYEPGINLVFGLNYLINDKLILGAELSPSFRYTTGTSVRKNSYDDDEITSDISGFHYGLSNGSVLLSLAYRF